MQIPVYEPWIAESEKTVVLEAVESGWISSKGKFVTQFEDGIAGYVGVRHGVATSSGTTALHAALLALGIGPGDEVIVPSVTFVATANAVAYTGATPVFADSEEGDWNICPESVDRLIGSKTKAIIAVHLYGAPCDLEGLQAIARERALYLIEDCAEAIGTKYQDRHVGSFSDIACFSFYGNKTITTGEGGMVVTNREDLARQVVRIRGQGLVEVGEYWHDILGYNYRMTNIAAAIGVAQLERIEEVLRLKRRVAEVYQELLGQRFQFQRVRSEGESSFWMVCLLAEDLEEKIELRNRLLENEIESRPVFPMVNSFPMYSDRKAETKTARLISERGLNLPSSPLLKDDQIQKVCDVLLQSR